MVQFFSTQKCVNYDKIEFATKQRKSQNKSEHQTHDRCGEISDFSISVIWRNFSTWQMWRISDFSSSMFWRNLKFLLMWSNFIFLHICHVEKSEMFPHFRCGEFKIYFHLSCGEIWNLSTWHIFSTYRYGSLVKYVNNQIVYNV